MKKFASLSLSFILLLTLSIGLYISEVRAQEGTPAEQAPSEETFDPDKDLVAKVNDFEITYTNYQIAINNLMPKMAYHKSVSEKRMKKIEEKALDNLVMDQLLYEEAIKRSITASKREVKQAIRDFQNKLPKGTTLRKVLKQSNMTRDDLKEVFRRSMMLRKIKDESSKELYKKVEERVDEKYMKDYYDNNLDKFVEPAQLHLSEILLKADPAGGKRHWLEVRDQTLAIGARIRGGADFAEVAKEVSQDPYAPKGGDMGWVHSGTLTVGIEEATQSLKEGEISDPIETLYGYHIVKIHERKAKKLKPYDKLNHEKLKKDLNASEYKRTRQEWVDSLKAKAVIIYYDDANE